MDHGKFTHEEMMAEDRDCGEDDLNKQLKDVKALLEARERQVTQLLFRLEALRFCLLKMFEVDHYFSDDVVRGIVQAILDTDDKLAKR